MNKHCLTAYTDRMLSATNAWCQRTDSSWCHEAPIALKITEKWEAINMAVMRGVIGKPAPMSRSGRMWCQAQEAPSLPPTLTPEQTRKVKQNEDCQHCIQYPSFLQCLNRILWIKGFNDSKRNYKENWGKTITFKIGPLIFQIIMKRNTRSHDQPNGVMDITFWQLWKFPYSGQ